VRLKADSNSKTQRFFNLNNFILRLKPINFENANLLFAEHFFTWKGNKTEEKY
jgi:hypothetical protein